MREKLRQLRIARGLTQKQFADKAGISCSHYEQIENGAKTPSLKFAMQIKKAMGYSKDDIFVNSSPIDK